jgi:type VI protein secretion system component Hcp
LRITTLILWLGLLATPAYSGTFLRIDGIPGDSQDPKHKKEIGIAWFQLTGQTLSFTKKIDVASPRLFLSAANGKHIAYAVLADGPDTDRRLYTFEDILVTSFKQKLGSPTAEEVNFAFAKLKIESIGQADAKGSTKPMALRDTMSSSGSSSVSANTGQSLAILMKADPIQSSPMVTKSLEWGIRNAGNKAQFQPFAVQKALDEGSDRFMQYSQTGQRIPEVKVNLQRQGADFFIYRLQDVVVSDYSRTGSGEAFKLQCGKIEVEIKAPSTGGVEAGKAGWDLKANKKV